MVFFSNLPDAQVFFLGLVIVNLGYYSNHVDILLFDEIALTKQAWQISATPDIVHAFQLARTPN